MIYIKKLLTAKSIQPLIVFFSSFSLKSKYVFPIEYSWWSMIAQFCRISASRPSFTASENSIIREIDPNISHTEFVSLTFVELNRISRKVLESSVNMKCNYIFSVNSKLFEFVKVNLKSDFMVFSFIIRRIYQL